MNGDGCQVVMETWDAANTLEPLILTRIYFFIYLLAIA